ncbi:MAG TPA: response regulator [Longimicrobiaceae bacterium]|nr:response regulator [Longimicrobiaceae bacterium]
MSVPVILLVEDDANDVLLIRHAFRKAGEDATIHVASDGDQAVAYLAGEGEFAERSRYPLPAFVLLDVKLPRRSGHEVLAWIRDQPVLRRIPVVMLTSSDVSSDRNRAYDLGANSYLVKPSGTTDRNEMVRLMGLYWLSLNRPPELSQ